MIQSHSLIPLLTSFLSLSLVLLRIEIYVQHNINDDDTAKSKTEASHERKKVYNFDMKQGCMYVVVCVRW